MNKGHTVIVLLIVLILLLSVLSLVGVYLLSQEVKPPMQVNPAPERPEYVPEPLTIEFYNDTVNLNMSAFKKYPVSEDEPEKAPDTLPGTDETSAPEDAPADPTP